MNNIQYMLATLVVTLSSSLAWGDGHGNVAPMQESNIEIYEFRRTDWTLTLRREFN